MRILILGASGMAGWTLYMMFSEIKKFSVFGTIRDRNALNKFSNNLKKNLILLDVIKDSNLLNDTISQINPDLIINCIGAIKHKSNYISEEEMYNINTFFPKKLAKMSSMYQFRMIHISTDCVFKGDKGSYSENSISDVEDVYGKSKNLGEITQNKYVINLRLSIIGHELFTNHQLVDWFLSQKDNVYGYKKAIFSGITTFELFKVINNFIIKNENLFGLYHVSSDPIDKYSLLKIIAEVYKKKINIIPDDSIIYDRSLNSDLFFKKTNYKAPEWNKMIKEQYDIIFNRSIINSTIF